MNADATKSDTFESLPPAIIERIRSEFDLRVFRWILNGMAIDPVTTCRANRLKSQKEGPKAELERDGIRVETSDFVPKAAWVPLEDRSNAAFSSAHEGKRIYVQNLASF